MFEDSFKKGCIIGFTTTLTIVTGVSLDELDYYNLFLTTVYNTTKLFNGPFTSTVDNLYQIAELAFFIVALTVTIGLIIATLKDFKESPIAYLFGVLCGVGLVLYAFRNKVFK